MNPEPSNFLLRKRGKYWNVLFKIPNSGRWTTAKSTGTKDKLKALAIVMEWAKNGIPARKSRSKIELREYLKSESILSAVKKAPLLKEEAEEIVKILESRGLVNVLPRVTNPGDVEFLPFFENFWNYEKSTYVKDRLVHKKSITKKHCYDMAHRLTHWEAFRGRMMSSITELELKQLCVQLSEKGLADATINKTMLAGTTPLKWAKKNKLIASNPAESLERISETNEERGILTDEEVQKLFSIAVWKDEMARVRNILVCTTGLRLGGCLGIQRINIKESSLEVWNWTEMDGRKKPKNNKLRIVLLIKEIKDELLMLLQKNLHDNSDTNYVFYGTEPDKPALGDNMLNGLVSAMESIGISNEQRKERNIDFHSWRHYYTSNVCLYVDEKKLKTVTGHNSSAVFNVYAGHKKEVDVLAVAAATKKAFVKMLKREKEITKVVA